MAVSQLGKRATIAPTQNAIFRFFIAIKTAECAILLEVAESFVAHFGCGDTDRRVLSPWSF
jgi:hypothetical protein